MNTLEAFFDHGMDVVLWIVVRNKLSPWAVAHCNAGQAKAGLAVVMDREVIISDEQRDRCQLARRRGLDEDRFSSQSLGTRCSG